MYWKNKKKIGTASITAFRRRKNWKNLEKKKKNKRKS